VTDAQPQLRRGVYEAFYSLGTFVMLVQATPKVRDRWSWNMASQPLYDVGQPSLGSMALVHTLRTLGRLTLEHALVLQARQAGSHNAAHAREVTERDVTAALADALVLCVPCFKPHWKKMVVQVVRMLSGEEPDPDLPQLYLSALAFVQKDLQLLREAAKIE